MHELLLLPQLCENATKLTGNPDRWPDVYVKFRWSFFTESKREQYFLDEIRKFNQENSTNAEIKKNEKSSSPLEFILPAQRFFCCVPKGPSEIELNQNGDTLCIFGSDGTLDSWLNLSRGSPGSKCDKNYRNDNGLCMYDSSIVVIPPNTITPEPGQNPLPPGKPNQFGPASSSILNPPPLGTTNQDPQPPDNNNQNPRSPNPPAPPPPVQPVPPAPDPAIQSSPNNAPPDQNPPQTAQNPSNAPNPSTEDSPINLRPPGNSRSEQITNPPIIPNPGIPDVTDLTVVTTEMSEMDKKIKKYKETETDGDEAEVEQFEDYDDSSHAIPIMITVVFVVFNLI